MRKYKKKLPRVQCFYCGKRLTKKNYSQDHIRPKARGGTDKPSNKVPACKDCNVRKGCLNLDQFRAAIAQERGLLQTTMKFFGEIMSTDKQLAHQREIRRQRKASGLCMRCGKVPAQLHKVDCKECSLKANQSRTLKVSRGICPYCKEQNPIIENKCWCLPCAEKMSKLGKIKRQELKDQGICVKCRINKTNNSQVHCELCAEIVRNYHRRNKQLCFEAYGQICQCCGLGLDARFLTLDHIANDGNIHREEIGHSTLYRWAIKNNFPETLQTLCWNCNMGKSVNKGICPHKEI